jgi:glycosyltransferase involved in cell wall biosynthesis
MAEAKAFVYAAGEDFGIAVVEAQACGTPVIAYAAGGALETVLDNRQHPETGTGLFFPSQTAAGVVEAVKEIDQLQGKFSPEMGRLRASGFAPEVFEQRYLAFVEQCYQEFQSRDFTKSGS